MFTACLEGGRNTMSDSTIGIVRFDTKTARKVLDVYGGVFYSPTFDNMQEGACCYIAFEVDFNAPENDPAVLELNGYYTVTVTYKEDIDKYMMSPGTLTDTTQVLADETPVTNALDTKLGYLNGVLFMAHQLKKASDQREIWDLSYDMQNRMTEESGRHIYNVYLRATVRVSSAKTQEEGYDVCAYEMKYFMDTAAEQEKNAGQTTFYIRFHYVSEINGDILTWKHADMEMNVGEVITTAP
jgi:hypothetical protein